MDCLVSGLLCPLLDYILCVSRPLIVQMYSLSYKDCYKWSLNFGLPVCGNNHNYLACQGFCHPLKWSQRLFDRKFYPDFRIRPNVPWQFFFSVLTTGSQRMPGDQKSISLLLSLLSNHYQLEALSFLSTNPCNSIWFFQPVVYETFENVPLSKSQRSRMLSRPELLVRHKD